MTTTIDFVPFADLLDRSRKHRAEHGCGGYPYDKGSLLRAVAAAVSPRRIVEVGTAVGYTAVCWPMPPLRR